LDEETETKNTEKKTMTIQFGGSGNLQLKNNFNPRTGAQMPKFGTVERASVVAGTLPKRGKRGGGGDPLARIPGEILKTFQGLKAPSLAFQTLETKEKVRAVDQHDEDLKARIVEGEIKLYNVRGEEVTDVRFFTEPSDEHPEGEEYTAAGVEPIEELDRIPVQGDPNTLNKLYNAMATFNKATGKQLRMLLDHNVMDDKGNILEQVKVIWRVH
jgi:hypothetical protein